MDASLLEPDDGTHGVVIGTRRITADLSGKDFRPNGWMMGTSRYQPRRNASYMQGSFFLPL